MSEEKWKSIPHTLPCYTASNFGRIKSGHRILLGSVGSTGYRNVTIFFMGRQKTQKVHRLVALAFGIIEPKDHVNHIDGNKLNNRLENLERSNYQHNNLHAFRTGLNKPLKGEENGRAKLSEADVILIRTTCKTAEDKKRFAKQFDVDVQHIRSILNPNQKKWKHIEEIWRNEK